MQQAQRGASGSRGEALSKGAGRRGGGGCHPWAQPPTLYRFCAVGWCLAGSERDSRCPPVPAGARLCQPVSDLCQFVPSSAHPCRYGPEWVSSGLSGPVGASTLHGVARRFTPVHAVAVRLAASRYGADGLRCSWGVTGICRNASERVVRRFRVGSASETDWVQMGSA